MNSSASHLKVSGSELGNTVDIFLIISIFHISDLPDKKLFPTVSAVYGNTEVSMVYLGPPLDG